jgi:hypothetical protein
MDLVAVLPFGIGLCLGYLAGDYRRSGPVEAVSAALRNAESLVSERQEQVAVLLAENDGLRERIEQLRRDRSANVPL